MKWRPLVLILLFPGLTLAQTYSRKSLCAPCHSQVQTQPSTSMAHALEAVHDSKILITNPVLTTQLGKYAYRIERKGDQSFYSVSDGPQQLTLTITWVMGASSAIGQTYVLEKDGELYESRVSYFSELKGLAPTIGSENSQPRNLTEAAGRRMTLQDKLQCFGCHATDARAGGKLTWESLIPGVQCQRCHQSPPKHSGVIVLNSPGAPLSRERSKSAPFSADQVSHFCGQCHRTWEEISAQGLLGIGNIRFQPYRLQGSKCYDPGDARISCLACHDPHRELSTKAEDYDSKCQTCHGGAKAGARACPVSSEKCVTCHMPRLELPGAHHKFSDHRIRIVRANEPYPG